MNTRRNKIFRGKKLLPLALLLLGGLVLFACTGTSSVPRGWSGGTVADGILFIGSMEGKLVAVNTADGSRPWAPVVLESTPPSGGFGSAPAPAGVAIYGSPAVAGDLVYVGGYNGKIYAFAFDRDTPRWIYPRQGNIGGPIVGGPVIAQDKLYFGSVNGKVYALDADEGYQEWEFKTGGKIWSTPAVEANTLFIGSFDKKLYALDATTGIPKWVFETEGAIVATPLVDNDTVYIGSFDRYLYAIRTTDGSLKWKFMAENWFWTKPVLFNGAIYAAALDGRVYVLNAENGRKLVEPIDLDQDKPISPISASPVLVGNSIVVATEDGVIYALDTGSKQPRELKRLGEKVQAPLASDGTVVYIHTSTGNLYALNAQSGAELRSPVSLKSVPSPSPSQQSSGGTNWGLLITITVISIVMVMVFRLLAKRRRA